MNPTTKTAIDLQPNAASHLTSEQMEAMLRSSPYQKQASKHLGSCETCHDEVDNLSQLLQNFRTASTQYANDNYAAAERSNALGLSQPVSRRSSWRWPLAAGALACALLAPAWVHLLTPMVGSHPAVQTKADNSQTAELSDDALLQGVQSDLSASVPNSLQVLSAPSSASSSTAASGYSLSKQSQ